MSAYRHPALKQLADQQVRFVPPPRRLEQLKQAETAAGGDRGHEGVSVPVRLLPHHRLSPRRLPGPVDQWSGPRYDLGLMISELAESLPAIPIEEVQEPVLTLEQISKKLNVTTKTINRWRSAA